jgi:sucrose phosphorylase
MADLVLNHCSRDSEWFQDHANGIAPGRDFFIEVDPATDLSAVVRPRSKPLLTEVPYIDQSRWVWTTFSEDQIDLNFADPDVLFEFLDILLFYVSMGAAAVRLDAIAYLWKRIGTPCIHLDETHEVVKLMRDVLHLVAPHVLLITETNVPHDENVSYFGKSDEAHVVYQFSLPPLLAHAIQVGTGKHLTRWAAGLEDPPRRCTYLNFTASHDGVGLRPLEGILSPAEVAEMIAKAEETGAQVSTKANADGSHTPYELNCTYLDALAAGDDDAVAAEKFLCSQTVALGLKGIPAIYFNSLFGGRNWLAGAELTGRARTLNRQKWALDELSDLLGEPGGFHANIFTEYTRRVTARTQHPAFHPKSAQEVIDVDDRLFVFRRTATNGGGSVLCVHNVSGQDVSASLSGLGVDAKVAAKLTDLLGSSVAVTAGAIKLGPHQSLWLTDTP